MPFGLFVDIGDVEGLVHISKFMGARERPGQQLQPRSKGRMRDRGHRTEKNPCGFQKISLSLKQISANPWTEVSAHFQPGQSVMGK